MAETQTIMSTLDIIARRGSIRFHEVRRIDHITIKKLLAAAMCAPTMSAIAQSGFAVVQGRGALTLICRLAGASMADVLAKTDKIDEREACRELRRPEFDIFYGPDTLILICAASTDAAPANCGLATDYLLRAASAMNLGSRLIDPIAAGFDVHAIKTELRIPAEMDVIVPILLGADASQLFRIARNGTSRWKDAGRCHRGQ